VSDVVISLRGLGKRYRLGRTRAAYKTLRESLSGSLSAPLARFGGRRNGAQGPAQDFWALRDVSFDIERGDVVGIIGRNGAGKSTLLKILSRITDPTEGYADIAGRVGSLLEVGTGFHQELTGRENIYLNGAILGMKRAEIDRKLDEIVDFSEVCAHIDTPVKHYSSGMYLRLAFAVAVHLESEILFVDEVLAVGDAQFQKKCLQKMREVSRRGLTILFVSHNMAALREICNHGIVLDRGCVVKEGDVNQVADWYVVRSTAGSHKEESIETKDFKVDEVSITSAGCSAVKTFGSLRILVRFRSKRDIQDPSLVVNVMTAEHQHLGMLNFKDFKTVGPLPAGNPAGLGFEVTDLPLLPGEYWLEIILKDRVTNEWDPLPRLYPFEVVETPVYGGRKIVPGYGHIGWHADAFAILGDGAEARIEEEAR
jgi:ABC-type polysaccharide/polyol phosphate transport system ATPase subunit